MLRNGRAARKTPLKHSNIKGNKRVLPSTLVSMLMRCSMAHVLVYSISHIYILEHVHTVAQSCIISHFCPYLTQRTIRDHLFRAKRTAQLLPYLICI